LTALLRAKNAARVLHKLFTGVQSTNDWASLHYGTHHVELANNVSWVGAKEKRMSLVRMRRFKIINATVAALWQLAMIWVKELVIGERDVIARRVRVASRPSNSPFHKPPHRRGQPGPITSVAEHLIVHLPFQIALP
jgi:hypothetical protein